MNSIAPRHGAIGVVFIDQRFLVVKRSQHVRAPGMLCFPGGGIEAGETEEAAVVRELREEIGAVVTSTRQLWQCTTAWKTPLTWFQCTIEKEREFTLDPHEVDSIHWLSLEELRKNSQVLSSNHAFLDAWEAGEFMLDAVSSTNPSLKDQ